MSAHSRDLQLSSRALLDYDDILLYTESTWGIDTADRYESALNRGFDTLLAHPLIGALHDELGAGTRVFPIERHLVYYRIRKNTVEIHRILHERSVPSLHLLSN